MWPDVQDSYALAWPDDSGHAGLAVTVSATSLAATLAAEKFNRRVTAGRVRGKDVERLAAVFVEHVEAWSVTRAGELVPVTVDGLLSLHRDTALLLLRQWVSTVLDPPRPPDLEPAPVEEPETVEDFLQATTLMPVTEDMVEVDIPVPELVDA